MEEHHTFGTRQTFFDKLIFGVLLAVTALAPIFFVPASFISPQFGTSLLFAFGVMVALCAYLLNLLLKGKIDLPKFALYILPCIAVVPLVYALAGYANGFSRMTFFGYTFDISTVGFIALGFLYLFLVSLAFKEKNRIFYSYFAFLISSLILSLFLLSRIIFGVDFLSFGKFTDLTMTPIGTWNNVGIFFAVGAILSMISFEMVRVSHFMKILLSLALLLSLFFLTLVNFPAVWWALAACSFLFILFFVFNREHGGKSPLSTLPLSPSIVFTLAVIFIIWGSPLSSHMSAWFKISNVDVRPSLSVTLDIAKNTLHSHPLFGSGPNTFVTQWLSWRPDEVLSTIFWNTDFTNGIGLLPTFAVTTGLLGIASWLIFLVFYLFLGIRSIFAKGVDHFSKYLQVSSFFVSLYLWVMTFAYVPSAVIFILTFFFTGLFLSSAYVSGILEIKTRIFSGSAKGAFLSSILVIGVLIASLSMGYGLFENSKSLWYFQKSSFALDSKKDLDAAEKNMQLAIASVPQDVYYRSLSHIELLKVNAILSQDPKQVNIADVQKQFQETLAASISAGLAAKDADKTNYINWIAVGQVYDAASLPALHVEGAFDSAKMAYTEALHRNPKNPGILVLLSRLALTKGDLKMAEDYATQAVEQKQNYLDAYFLLSQIEVASKNLPGAIKSVSAAAVINPTDPAIFFELGLLKYNVSDFKGAVEALEKAKSLTPDYANAKYFLGLAYEATGQHEKAISEFLDLKVTNPDSGEVSSILANLQNGKSPFAGADTAKPEKGKGLPVKEKI